MTLCLVNAVVGFYFYIETTTTELRVGNEFVLLFLDFSGERGQTAERRSSSSEVIFNFIFSSNAFGAQHPEAPRLQTCWTERSQERNNFIMQMRHICFTYCKFPSIVKLMHSPHRPAIIRSSSITYDGHRMLTTHDATVDVALTNQGTPATVSGPVCRSRLH